MADYLLGIIYPGEGTANLALYRDATINFLKHRRRRGDPSPLVGLSTGNPSPFENRVRGAVAMLLTLQRFQEQ